MSQLSRLLTLAVLLLSVRIASGDAADHCRIELTKASVEFVEARTGYLRALKEFAETYGRSFSIKFGAQRLLLEMAATFPDGAANTAKMRIESVELKENDGHNASKSAVPAGRVLSALRMLCFTWNELGGVQVELGTLYTYEGAKAALEVMKLHEPFGKVVESPEKARILKFVQRPDGGFQALMDLNSHYGFDFFDTGLVETLKRWTDVFPERDRPGLLTKIAVIGPNDANNAPKAYSTAARLYGVVEEFCKTWNRRHPTSQFDVSVLEDRDQTVEMMVAQGAIEAGAERDQKLLDPKYGAVHALSDLGSYWSLDFSAIGGPSEVFRKIVHEAKLSEALKHTIRVDQLLPKDGYRYKASAGIAKRLRGRLKELLNAYRSSLTVSPVFDIDSYWGTAALLEMLGAYPTAALFEKFAEWIRDDSDPQGQLLALAAVEDYYTRAPEVFRAFLIQKWEAKPDRPVAAALLKAIFGLFPKNDSRLLPIALGALEGTDDALSDVAFNWIDRYEIFPFEVRNRLDLLESGVVGTDRQQRRAKRILDEMKRRAG